jgi:hypothetical protein
MKTILAAAALLASLGLGLASTDVNAQTRDHRTSSARGERPDNRWRHSSQQQTAPSGGVSVSNTSAGNRR